MLSILEKAQYVLSGVVVLGALTLYLVWTPDIRDVESVPKPVRVQAPKKDAAAAKPGDPAPPPGPSAANRAILEKLQREHRVPGIAGKDLQMEEWDVEKDTVSYISHEPNWIPELEKAKSQLLPGADGKKTRLKLFDIEENSLIKKFGFSDGDIVELIDGDRIDFEGSSSTDHIGRWKKLKAKLEKGERIGLTITRGGQPIQLDFKMK